MPSSVDALPNVQGDELTQVLKVAVVEETYIEEIGGTGRSIEVVLKHAPANGAGLGPAQGPPEHESLSGNRLSVALDQAN